ncbi:hypothetical protein AYJ57_14160 [Salipiger sp. CCB-MM3]|nr:hypothetical protein AYJ57_14160 [Salipiger sp. CCB-MM3]
MLKWSRAMGRRRAIRRAGGDLVAPSGIARLGSALAHSPLAYDPKTFLETIGSQSSPELGAVPVAVGPVALQTAPPGCQAALADTEDNFQLTAHDLSYEGSAQASLMDDFLDRHAL